MIPKAVFTLLLVIISVTIYISGDEKSSVKINGVSLVSPSNPVNDSVFIPIKNLHANWVAIIPYAFSRNDSPSVRYDYPRQWWGERKEGVAKLIECAKKYDIKVMLKPHVWVRGDGWAGDFKLESEEQWKIWENDYEDYILHFAKIADSLNVELFCIGTEYRKAVVMRPDFWLRLIEKVRAVYAGKLTYAANWDNYQQVGFWDKLDFIGVDAYFPISEKTDPSVEDLVDSWSAEFNKLESLAEKENKEILFTEYGYQSISGTAGKHWEADKTKINLEAQSRAYQALYNVFWKERWFAGGFLWKWHFRNNIGGVQDHNYTPQGKPAEDLIRNHFAAFQ